MLGAPGATHADTTDPYSQVGALSAQKAGAGRSLPLNIPSCHRSNNHPRSMQSSCRPCACVLSRRGVHGRGLSADRRRSLCAREFRKLGFSVSDSLPRPLPLPLHPGLLLLLQRAGTSQPVFPLPPRTATLPRTWSACPLACWPWTTCSTSLDRHPAPTAGSVVGWVWGMDGWGTGHLSGASQGLVMTPQPILCSPPLLSLC